MNDLREFGFEGKAVRVVMVNDEPWWVAKDVAEALGCVWNGAGRIEHVPVEWKGVTSVVTPGGMQEMAILSEQGLYFFLGRSDKVMALPFQKWIAGKVVPSIRKTGGYLSPAVDFSDPEKIQVLLDNWKEDRKKRLEAEARVERLVHNNRTYSTTEISKELGMKSAQELNQLLCEKGIQYKDRRGVWLLYADYADKGFQNIKQKEKDGAVIYYSEWTGIGRDWLLGLLSR